ncbi:BMC domain-containing protein [Listeria sp. FSL L7-0233]|uniref:BMC domain-containing protein n=1 Tax=Listeria cossartiae TaxID=2838249 RepID=UPI001628EC22|nr:BMC domain-containing protein [Listeria cossartiae]MBC1543631.1 BMC domain-containing protein [Listeria cossartiae subsp. cossartiae]MBC1546032.1 BMC domain-containing protein [Listeria cossartiae subsp. cossartiae]MBC1548916.1 BMC domain-containing protein [Listeria cossartiae subsp. cossartiae]MBC1567377.1 BMC domain-containing protein [Listeria cossartiae subsp. cossartiae]MBC1570533.1 BMC domain-containing protein [Listeria cossartiae subsp. cossartiae]
MHQAIGMIEIKGLASAITVADTMAKVANIQLVDTETAKGFGWITVKVEGDVAAVNAALEAGEQTAIASDSFIAKKVIPRPGEEIFTVFWPKEDEAPEKLVEKEVIIEPEKVAEPEVTAEATCNLCHDPLCPRVKGDPRQDCIHFEEEK